MTGEKVNKKKGRGAEMVTAKKNLNRVIMLTLAFIMAIGTFTIENASAAYKEIGLVSESEYYAKYTDTSKYQATPPSSAPSCFR